MESSMSEETTAEPKNNPVQCSQMLLKNAAKLTKHANELPNSGLDWDYYTSFSSFSDSMSQGRVRLLQMMKKIYNHYGLTGRVDKLDVEEQVEMVSDLNDTMMERINNFLDEASGIKKQVETVVVEVNAKPGISGSWNQVSKSGANSTYRLLSAKNILRPQLKFKEKVNNKPLPFVPKIKEKPHSLKPLAILLEINDFGEEEYSHPYEFELERFTPAENFVQPDKVEPAEFKAVNETPLVFIDSETSLKQLLDDLSKQTEIAVDLEAHSYRTFQGITCLMQISTSSTDYIVDTLELWDNLHCLNEVFCNPKILKIFHGADKDVEWLQRDFGLYLVNLFDTYQAAKLLNFPHLSLAYLLRHYCKVTVNKEFQLADWRIRPLPQEMINYAREDTHYLIYIYQKMKRDLLDRSVGNNLLVAVWENSRHTCLKRYSIQKIGPESHLELYRQSKRTFNNRQLFALREIFQWRDKVAREEDESVGFVLPKHMMLQIAEVLPREMQGILACCNPIPPLVRQHLLALHNIILRAREMPLTQTPIEGLTSAVTKSILTPLEHDTEDPLHCVHDLTHSQDIRDDLPTLLGSSSQAHDCAVDGSTTSPALTIQVKDSPSVPLFYRRDQDAKTAHENPAVTFVTPYQRYARTKAVQKMAFQQDLVETQKRIEKVHQHFINIVGNPTSEEPTTESKESQDVPDESSKSEPVKKKMKRPTNQPLSKQLPNRKRKKVKQSKAAESVVDMKDKSETVEASNVDEAETPPKKIKSNPVKKTKKGSAQSLPAGSIDQSAGKVAPFDYSQVDFKAFQQADVDKKTRGGKRTNRGANQFKNKMIRNRGAKSLTYSSKQQ